MRKIIALAFAVIAAAVLAGCSGASNGVNASNGFLTNGQLSAAVGSGNAVDYSAIVLDVLNVLTSSQVNGSGTPASGPTITVTSTSSGKTVIVDYGTGVTGDGGATTSGTVTIAIDTTAHTATVTFTNFIVNSHTVTGSITLSALSYSPTGVSATATFNNLTISGIGTVTGSLSFTYTSSTRTLNIPSGNLTYTDTSSNVYTIALTNVTFAYGSSNTIRPTSGTITITFTPGGFVQQTLILTFSVETATSNRVGVSVNNGPSVSLVFGALE